MGQRRTLEDYVEQYRNTADPEELRQFNEHVAHFRLANQILEARKRQKITQVELAARSGVGQGEISRIENGEGNPTVATLTRLGTQLGISLSFESQ